MTEDMLCYFETIFDKEAERVDKLIIEKYNKKEIVNKTFGELVRDLMNKELLFYRPEIEFRALRMLPNDLRPDPSSKYALITKIEDSYQVLHNYSKRVINYDTKKSPQIAALKLSNIIIDMYKNKTLNNYTLIDIIANNMNKIYNCEYDTLDARAIVLYLRDSLKSKGYIVVSINPFDIKEIK